MLDISEYFGVTSGGIRTYLNAKSAWVAEHHETRQVLVVPARHDAMVDSKTAMACASVNPALRATP